MATKGAGFGPQKSYVGKYNSSDNSKTNPLADNQLMSKSLSENIRRDYKVFGA